MQKQASNTQTKGANGAIGAINQITSQRSRIRANLNSERGIEAKNIVTLLKGFHEKIDHDPYSESTYEISKERHKIRKEIRLNGRIPL